MDMCDKVGKLLVPVKGFITQRYGENVEYYKKWGYCCGHNGLDYGVPIGTEVRASTDGTVIATDFETGGYGNFIKLEHNGFFTYYAHLSEKRAKAGKKVVAGEVIGLSGNTGASTGPHLHFGLRVPGTYPEMRDYLDPLPYLGGGDYLPPTPDQEYLVVVVNMEVVVDALNVRGGAGVNYPKIGTLSNGQRIKADAVTAKCDAGLEVWFRISHADNASLIEGWCSGIYNNYRYLKQV